MLFEDGVGVGVGLGVDLGGIEGTLGLDGLDGLDGDVEPSEPGSLGVGADGGDAPAGLSSTLTTNQALSSIHPYIISYTKNFPAPLSGNVTSLCVSDISAKTSFRKKKKFFFNNTIYDENSSEE